jgi:hypothetical protein
VIDLAAAFRAVTRALDDAGLRYVVVGSTAAASWGVLRATRDIDIVTMIDEGADVLVTRLGADEDLYIPLDDAANALAGGGTFNVFHPRSGGKVDVFVRRTDDDFTRVRLERRVPADVLGVATWVATPEDVILAKLGWRLESRSEVQWRDCVEIAAIQSLDRSYMRTWAARLGVTADLEELLEQTAS